MDVSDQLGYLVLHVDGTLQSSYGELANNETAANIISNLVTIAKSIPPHEEKYKKISIVYPDTLYIVCLSNNRIHVTKLRRNQHASDTDSESIVGSIN